MYRYHSSAPKPRLSNDLDALIDEYIDRCASHNIPANKIWSLDRLEYHCERFRNSCSIVELFGTDENVEELFYDICDRMIRRDKYLTAGRIVAMFIVAGQLCQRNGYRGEIIKRALKQYLATVLQAHVKNSCCSRLQLILDHVIGIVISMYFTLF